MPEDRRLAAIMFTDIVGYTSLMGESEKKAFETINSNREIHQRLTEKHHGKIVKELGDGLLTVFENGTEAVICAIAIQKESREKNIPLRIGIHEGEVVFKNGDVFGDGVNIASRIQAEAATGGVCISDTVYRIIRNKEEFEAKKIGNVLLKNVKEPLLLYQLKSPGLVIKSRRKNFRWWLTILSFIIGTAVGIYLSYNLINGANDDQVNRYEINLPEYTNSGTQNNMAIAPDGSVIVYVGQKDQSTVIYKRNLNSYKISIIYGTEGANSPFFSPDGKWIGFYSQGKLHKMLINGGKIYDLCNLSELKYATWLPNDSIIIGGVSGEGLKIISSSGGIIRDLTKINYDKLEWYHTEPSHIYGTDKILYSVKSVSGSISVNLCNYITGEDKVLIHKASNPKYTNSGHIVYEFDGSLYASEYDKRNDIINESSYLMIEGDSSEFNAGIQYNISNEGTLIYCDKSLSRIGELVLVDMKGNIKSIRERYDSYRGPKFSPDGKYIAFWRNHLKNDQVWIYDIERESLFQFTTEGQNFWPIWSPNGKYLYFPSLGPGSSNLNISMKSFVKEGPSTQIITSDITKQPKAWTSDGEHLLYHQREESEKGYGIYLYNKKDNQTSPFIDDSCDEGKPDFSPKNNWVVYESNKTGQYEVYVTDFPNKIKKYQISVSGGYEPLWSHTGDKIFYRSNNDFFVVHVTMNPDIIFSKPEYLFSGDYLYTPKWGRYYDLSPDEKYFVTVREIQNDLRNSNINVITNWFVEVKQKTAEK